MPYVGKSPSAVGVRSRYYFTASGGETSLSGSDNNGKTLVFTDAAYVDVILNGNNLVSGTDYVAVPNTNTISGLAALVANDVVEIISYDVFSVSDTVPASTGGTFSGSLTVSGAISSNKGSAGTLATFTDGVNSNFVVETSSLLTTIGNGGGSTALALKANNTEALRISSSGNVGIGTSSPVSQLMLQSAVNSTGYTEMLRLEGQTLSNGWERGIAFTGNSGGLEVSRISSYLTGLERHLRFTSAGTLGMTIRETGFVGIGITSPNEKLSVSGNIELYNDEQDGYIWFHDAGTRSWTVGSDQSTGNFAITNQTDLASGHKLIIDPNGNVGIGVSSMTNKLVLPNAAYFAMQDTGGAESLAIRANSSNAMEFLTGGGVKATITSSGNVGIGTTLIPADALLTVNSGIKLNIATSSKQRIYSLYAGTNPYSLNSSGGAAVVFDRLADNSDELAFETHYAGNSHLERMRISKEGRVTMPYQPAFRAVLISSTNTAGNYLVFETVDYNIGNHYNSSTGIFTAPVAGRYMVTVQGFNETLQNSQLYVQVNNTNKSYSLSYAGATSSGNQYNMMSQSSIFNLSANDTVRVYCNAGEIYAASVDSNSFSCYLLG